MTESNLLISVPELPSEKLDYTLDLAWQLLLTRLLQGGLRINKEASLQLHFGALVLSMGVLMCFQRGEYFTVELEQNWNGQNIDMVCGFYDGDGATLASAAVELKCFLKTSNRGRDNDMYDVLRDIERLSGYRNFNVKRFICLTDDSYYQCGPKTKSTTSHPSQAQTVAIWEGRTYRAGQVVVPTWRGKRKNQDRDKPIAFPQEVTFNWHTTSRWRYLNMVLG